MMTTEADSLPARALSIRQPWAWAILHAGKDVENRGARAVTLGAMTTGPVAVHASKGMTRDEYEGAARFMASLGAVCPPPDDLVRGAIVGAVHVTAIVEEWASPWFFGPRGLVLLAPTALATPIPVGGELGFFDWRKNVGQPWSATAIAEPKPWMRAWPGPRRRSEAAVPAEPPPPAALPLFGDGDAA
jgi:hypothetical protein